MATQNKPYLAMAEHGWAAFRDHNPSEPAECAFFVGFALAMATCRECGKPTSDQVNAVSSHAAALRDQETEA